MEHTSHPKSTAIGQVISTLLVSAVAVIMGWQVLEFKQTEARWYHIDACARVATVSFETKDEKTGAVTRSTLPSQDVYKQCLSDKNILVP